MSPRGQNPEDYEYGGNTPPVYAVDSEPVVRPSRLRATTVGTTALLVVAGLAGGAAFALSNPSQTGTSSAAPIVQSESSSVQTAENAAATPEPTASSTTQAATSTAAGSATSDKVVGKTIAVPPATFDDKNGEREFHENPPPAGSGSAPAAGSGQASTGSGTTGTPSFGGGDDHHKKRPVNTADIRFSGGSDDNGEDD